MDALMTTPEARFEAVAQPLRAAIEAQLDRYLAPVPGVPGRLRESMHYSLLAGGKRLRPILVLLAARACGSHWQPALPAACAIECIHTYSLVHDDLPAMDDDDYRRGRLTNHKVFGDALAILAGDALLTLAFEIVARDVQPPDVAARCCATLAMASGWAGMVAGQVADLEAEQQPLRELSQLEAVHRRKTGQLLCASLTLGALIAGADRGQQERLTDYGTQLGLAFQITDDLLDVAGNAEKAGKAVGKDAARGKLTYPGLLGIEESRQRARLLVQQAIAAVEPLGAAAEPLVDLARFVEARDH